LLASKPGTNETNLHLLPMFCFPADAQGNVPRQKSYLNAEGQNFNCYAKILITTFNAILTKKSFSNSFACAPSLKPMRNITVVCKNDNVNKKYERYLFADPLHKLFPSLERSDDVTFSEHEFH